MIILFFRIDLIENYNIIESPRSRHSWHHSFPNASKTLVEKTTRKKGQNHWIFLACPGLCRYDLNSTSTKDNSKNRAKNWAKLLKDTDKDYDAIVLGCTHYSLIKPIDPKSFFPTAKTHWRERRHREKEWAPSPKENQKKEKPKKNPPFYRGNFFWQPDYFLLSKFVGIAPNAAKEPR